MGRERRPVHRRRNGGGHALSQPHRFELRYFITEGHLDRWVYSTPECPKRIETDFAVAACNPG